MKKNKIIETEIIIIGSGAGGATLAKELSKQKRKIVVIEKGFYEEKFGRTIDTLKFYDRFGFLKSKEGTALYRTIMVGGTTVVAAGNGVRSLQKEFFDFGINLEDEFIEAEKELNVSKVPENKIIGGSREIMESAQKLGYQMEPISKFIDFKKCRLCGNCVFGCKFGAKWSAINYIDQAINNGVSLMTKTEVIKILSSNGKATGVIAIGPNGLLEVRSNIVILSAGGIGTPIILQKSGILNAGKKLFCDPFNVVYGISKKEINQLNGIQTTAVDYEFCESEGFVLLPFIDPSLQFMIYTMRKSLFGKLPRNKTLGIMVKIADEAIGKVDVNGKINKLITKKDKQKFKKGIDVAKEILIKANVDPKSFFITNYRAAHPGKTASIGELVDKNFETKIKNLFICDASIFPKAPGLPPILTIVALGKWLSKRL